MLRSLGSSAAVVAALSQLSVTPAAAAPSQVQCGDVITKSVKLGVDVVGTPGSGGETDCVNTSCA